MTITDTPHAPWVKVGVDLVGPLPPSKNGFINIWTCQDNFTKYVIAVPLKDASADSVAEALVKTLPTALVECFLKGEKNYEL